jgi:hypothetical protein
MSKEIESATHKAIRQAIVRIEKGKPKVVTLTRKMSVMAVAEESGFSRALIHRDHKDLANRINGGVEREVGARLSESQKKLAGERVKAKALRVDIKELKAALAEMTSMNLTLLLENERLHARGPGSNNVVH